MNNYRPVFLLPICGKIFEQIIYNPHQSGFLPNDSCIYQLISIAHHIYANFDHDLSLEVRGNFLDISKTFDKVWHEGLLYKLQSLGISGTLLNLFRVVSLMTDIKE